MRHPTKKQMQKVIDRMESILPIARKREQLAMFEPSVSYPYHACGTVHCFGGWYAVACKEREPVKSKIERQECNFIAGCNLMAKDLGFRNDDQLEDWAGSNPKIWGNRFGADMFLMSEAFSEPNKFRSAKSVADIVKHLKRVKRRLPK